MSLSPRKKRKKIQNDGCSLTEKKCAEVDIPLFFLIKTLKDSLYNLAILVAIAKYRYVFSDKARQDKTRHNKTQQDKTRQGKISQDETRRDETRQDKTRQDKTRQDKARQDKTRQGLTRQDKTRHNSTHTHM